MNNNIFTYYGLDEKTMRRHKNFSKKVYHVRKNVNITNHKLRGSGCVTKPILVQNVSNEFDFLDKLIPSKILEGVTR